MIWIWIVWLLGLIGFGYGIFIGGWISLWFILGLIWFALGMLLIYLASHSTNLNKLPLLTTPATVISKLHEKTIDGMAGITSTEHKYFIAFEFPDKSRKKLTVNAAQYAIIREDDTGILNYKQLDDNSLWFIDFQVQD